MTVTDSPRRVLDPVERVSEVLFGLIMVLTFTGSMSAATAGHAEVREMLVGALGCNLAWGIVDAVMYLMGALLSRARRVAVLRAMRSAADAAQERAILAGAIDADLASLLTPASLDAVRRDFTAAGVGTGRVSLTRDDWRGAVAVFLLVTLSTLPVTLPFLLVADVPRAMRVSNGIAVALLCLGGYSLARYGGLRPWPTAAAMTAVGVALVAITMALGG